MYFERAGKMNTDETVRIVSEYAKQNGIAHVVVASETGDGALRLLAQLPSEVTLAVVTHVIGMRQDGEDEMGAEMRKILTGKGARLVTTTHFLSGAERALSGSFGGAYPVEIIAHTLRMFGSGVKVAVECAIMALDAGAIPFGEPVIAIGGTGKGLDAAILLIPGHGARLFETRILEILCKPNSFVAPIYKKFTGKE